MDITNPYCYHPESADVRVDFSRQTGKVRAVNGICNAPTPATAPFVKALKAPYTRLHDSFLGNFPCVDIWVLFPDFDADENDPANYDFYFTDIYVNRIKDCGQDIIYRLGVSMESDIFIRHSDPPPDYEKWARICCKVISHYNEGWANGFFYNIKYWEIWNEPDGATDIPNPKGGQWTGTATQFYELYCVASTYIKKAFPALQIGGYAACSVDEPRFSRFFENFLSYIKTHEYCLDFFSYHAYGNSIQKLKNRVAYINETLQKTGIGRVPLLCTEYNSLWEFEGVWDLLAENDPYAQQEIFESMRSATAAAYILAAMITFQEIGVEIANFYRTDLPTGWDSLFNVYGVPQKPYYAALAFSYVGGREQVLSETPTNDLYAIAAKGDGENVILLSNYEARSREYMLQIDGLEDGEYELCEYLTDDTKNHELVRREIYTPRNLPKYIYIRSNSLRTLVLTKTPVKTGASRIDKSAPKEYN